MKTYGFTRIHFRDRLAMTGLEMAQYKVADLSSRIDPTWSWPKSLELLSIALTKTLALKCQSCETVELLWLWGLQLAGYHTHILNLLCPRVEQNYSLQNLVWILTNTHLKNCLKDITTMYLVFFVLKPYQATACRDLYVYIQFIFFMLSIG